MPYASNKQAAFMHIHHPEITSKWREEGHGYVKGGKNDPNRKKKRIRKSKGNMQGWLKPLAVGTAGGALANQFPSWEQRERRKQRKQGKVKKMYAPVRGDAAQKMFNLIMKMDDDTAEMFCAIVTADLLEEEIEKNMGTLQDHLDEVIAKQMRDAKLGLGRLVVKGQTGLDPYAEALALVDGAIRKADDIPNWIFERKIKRDPNSGRFQTKFTPGNGKKIPDRTATALGISGVGEERYNKLNREQKAEYQQQYLQVAEFLNAVNAATGGVQNNKVLIHYKNKKTGKTWASAHSSEEPPEDLMKPNVVAIGAEAQPTSLTVGGAAFSLAGAMGGGMSAQQVEGINRFDTDFGQNKKFVTAWTEAGKDQPGVNTARLYGRTAALGQVAGAVGPEGSKIQLAGKMAEIVGQYGPQAEQVLGPTARKTAYRYRGTERTPDKRLISTYRMATEEGKRRGPRDIFAEKEELQIRERRGQKGPAFTEVPTRGKGTYRRQAKPEVAPSIKQVTAERQARAGRAPEWLEREPGRQAVVDYLDDRIPTRQLYRLHLEAGNTPPSEGVIINSEGQIVTQAVGYGDDHYLPFNLKNLKALKGGEYIRNRSVGGLTSEDIYTGLISGARRVTVVSRSGTFTMEFQPDFRGGRRHNDKARRMTRRYEQILDAVQSEQVERAEVPVKWRRIIENEVRDEFGPRASKPMIRAEIDARIKEFKEKPEIEGRDLDRAETEISRMEDQERLGQATRQEVADYRKSIMNELRNMKEIKFRLNGVGYAAALDSLEEQFPYYIKTDHKTKEEGLLSFERDLGYVEPARNRPTAAKHGLHGTKKGETGKISAAAANYQRGRPGVPSAAENKLTRTGGSDEETSASAGSSGVSRPRSERERHREAALEAAEARKSKLVVRERATELQASTAGLTPPQPAPEWWGMSSDEFRNYINDDQKLKDFDRWVEANQSQLQSRAGNRLLSYRNARGAGSPIPWSENQATEWSNRHVVDKEWGPAYRAGARQADIEHEMRKIDREDVSLTHGRPLSELNEAQMREEVEQVATVVEGMKAQPGLPASEYQAMFGEYFDPKVRGFATKIFQPKGAIDHLKRVHQMRWLKAHYKPPNGTNGPTGLGGGGGSIGPSRPGSAGSPAQPGPPEPPPRSARLEPRSEEEVASIKRMDARLLKEAKANYANRAAEAQRHYEENYDAENQIRMEEFQADLNVAADINSINTLVDKLPKELQERITGAKKPQWS